MRNRFVQMYLEVIYNNVTLSFEILFIKSL